MIKPNYKKLKPIPEKELSEHGRMALKAMKRAMRKLRAEHKRLGMPLISWKDGKVIEVDP
ncbi:MAG TPA: hypothetical protein DEP88_08570 [Verrucomicrobiales bacterium]|jgi:hypothetical protein|nr:hypothetical protein [Verrucomicrobiales bacterium]HCL97315.1 hypothetical protein [Verrucomicrobiales bacterium]